MSTITNPFYARRFKRVATLQEAHHRPVSAGQPRAQAETAFASDRLHASLAELRHPGLDPRSHFNLGEIIYTGASTLRLRTEEVMTALHRHANGDWGDLLPEDAIANDLALKSGGKLFSAYGFGRDRFWVLTDFQLSVTAILMPDD
jgi:hypothetical protein